MYTNELPLHEL